MRTVTVYCPCERAGRQAERDQGDGEAERSENQRAVSRVVAALSAIAPTATLSAYPEISGL